MLATYNVGPLSATKNRILDFLQKTESETEYVNYIQTWEMRSRRDKTKLTHKNDQFTDGQMMMLQPYVELFTDYLLKNHKEEVETA
jgi:hypothetical protein